MYMKEDFVSMNFCVIGGDLRNFFLAKLLSKEKQEVKLYGFEKIDHVKKIQEYKPMIEDSDVIILPIPLTKNNSMLNMPFSEKHINIQDIIGYLENKIIFAGNIAKDTEEKLINKNNQVIDIMKKEEFAILNAIPTAEATIEIILKNMKKVLQGSHCLIMGFGRIGKVLAHKLQALLANVTCITMNKEEKAWAIVYGYEIVNIKSIQENCAKLKQYDIIINTIPKIILREELKKIRKETLVIDLASKPYGIDRKLVEEEKINFVEALGLPRKISTDDISKIYKRYHKRICIKYKPKKGRKLCF